MKICFIEEDFKISGGMRRVVECANGLVERGHEVDILIIIDDASLECSWMDCKATIKRFKDRSYYDVAIFNHAPVWIVLDQVRAKVKTYWWLGFEGAYFSVDTWQDAYYHSFHVLANSHWTAKMAELVYGFKPKVIYGGIDKKLFHPVEVKKEYEVLTCIPEDKKEKGYGIVKRACDVLGLPLENFALKNLPQEKLAEEYSKAKIFVGAPTVEGFYFPALEAMACRVPVVVTNAGGNTDYCHDHENCLLVPRNAGDIAYAIKELRDSPSLRKKLRVNGFRTAQRFSWQDTVDQLEEDLYAELGKI